MPTIAVKQPDATYRIWCKTCSKLLVDSAKSPESYAPLFLEHEKKECPATVTPNLWLFDNPETRRLTEARMDFITPLLRELRQSVGIESALDVGCGLGDFSGYLSEFGIPKVVGIDGREENVVEARNRHVGPQFQISDAEELSVQALGSFDLVLCFGLLYHLENPMRAIRMLRALTKEVLILESMCVPGDKPKLELLDEEEVSNQGLNHLGFYPSEPCLLKMLTRSGFPFVYEFLTLPPNPLYRDTSQRRRLRTMMLASHFELPSTMLRLSRDQKRPVEELADPWVKPSPRIWSRLGRAYRAFFAR
jgi:SAM-dependent methyltransferase